MICVSSSQLSFPGANWLGLSPVLIFNLVKLNNLGTSELILVSTTSLSLWSVSYFDLKSRSLSRHLF
ncbi:hypothetical protein V6N13_106116 [Hibiscus sabdariffa]